jgi:hypothetical protein
VGSAADLHTVVHVVARLDRGFASPIYCSFFLSFFVVRILLLRANSIHKCMYEESWAASRVMKTDISSKLLYSLPTRDCRILTPFFDAYLLQAENEIVAIRLAIMYSKQTCATGREARVFLK